MILIAALVAQLLVTAHQREAMQDIAIEAASFAALADENVATAESMAGSMIDKLLVNTDHSIQVSEVLLESVKVAKVQISADASLFAGWRQTIKVVGYAVLENQD